MMTSIPNEAFTSLLVFFSSFSLEKRTSVTNEARGDARAGRHTKARRRAGDAMSGAARWTGGAAAAEVR
jgi:hypothetical protein